MSTAFKTVFVEFNSFCEVIGGGSYYNNRRNMNRGLIKFGKDFI